MSYRCSYCGTAIPEKGYLCPSCGKVCRTKVIEVTKQQKEKVASGSSKPQQGQSQFSQPVQELSRKKIPVTSSASPASNVSRGSSETGGGQVSADNYRRVESRAAFQKEEKEKQKQASGISTDENAEFKKVLKDVGIYDIVGFGIIEKNQEERKDTEPQKDFNWAPVELDMSAFEMKQLDMHSLEKAAGYFFDRAPDLITSTGIGDGWMTGSIMEEMKAENLLKGIDAPFKKECEMLADERPVKPLADKTFMEHLRSLGGKYRGKPEKIPSGKPAMRIAILTCMCPQMSEVTLEALGLKPGDAIVVRTAGAVLGGIEDGAIKSLAIAVYTQKVREIIVLGHESCEMKNASTSSVLAGIAETGMNREALAIKDLGQYFGSWTNTRDAVRKSIEKLRASGIFPKGLVIHGIVFDPSNLSVNIITDGHEAFN